MYEIMESEPRNFGSRALIEATFPKTKTRAARSTSLSTQYLALPHEEGRNAGLAMSLPILIFLVAPRSPRSEPLPASAPGQPAGACPLERMGHDGTRLHPHHLRQLFDCPPQP